MPRNSPLFLVLTALAAGCGQGAAKACPPDDQAACMDPSLGYDAGIAAILNDTCMPCHAAGGVEANVPLTDYRHVFGERMTVAGQIVTCTMPPDGSPQLTDAERKQILDWLSCGAPQ
ncbi:MAG TPA: c-type cytochrome [Polyangiaceae bacterium]|nr:c-type cytochrome [Polyangiaceae bacterium]